jgi:transposase
MVSEPLGDDADPEAQGKKKAHDVEPWVCFQRGNPLAFFITNHDATDANLVCRRQSDIETVAKVIYYTGRALKTFEDAIAKLPPSPI